MFHIALENTRRTHYLFHQPADLARKCRTHLGLGKGLEAFPSWPPLREQEPSQSSPDSVKACQSQISRRQATEEGWLAHADSKVNLTTSV